MVQRYQVDTPLASKYFRKIVQFLPRIRGIPRLVYITRHIFLPTLDHMLLVDTPEGSPVTINPADYGQVMQFYFPYSPELRALLQDLLMPGDICIDFGANTGVLSIVMSEIVGFEGLVIAVDPNPDNIRLIQNTISRCSLGNLVTAQVGMAGQDGKANFAVPQGANSESGDIRRDRTEGLEVRLVTVNTLMNETAPGRTVDFIKYDVEGAEAELVQSLQTLLDQGERPALLVEFHPKKMVSWGQNAELIRKQLRSMDYDERWVEANNQDYVLKNDIDYLTDRYNILFVHPDQLNLRSRLRQKWSTNV